MLLKIIELRNILIAFLKTILLFIKKLKFRGGIEFIQEIFKINRLEIIEFLKIVA